MQFFNVSPIVHSYFRSSSLQFFLLLEAINLTNNLGCRTAGPDRPNLPVRMASDPNHINVIKRISDCAASPIIESSPAISDKPANEFFLFSRLASVFDSHAISTSADSTDKRDGQRLRPLSPLLPAIPLSPLVRSSGFLTRKNLTVRFRSGVDPRALVARQHIDRATMGPTLFHRSSSPILSIVTRPVLKSPAERAWNFNKAIITIISLFRTKRNSMSIALSS
jgi:hypothetical protein